MLLPGGDDVAYAGRQMEKLPVEEMKGRNLIMSHDHEILMPQPQAEECAQTGHTPSLSPETQVSHHDSIGGDVTRSGNSVADLDLEQVQGALHRKFVSLSYLLAMVSSSHSLFYPYPLNLNVANFVSLKLTHNFLLWKTQILALIESQDMEGFLTGSIAAPPSHIVDPADPQQLASNPKFESWRRSDRLIKGWITGTLSETVLGLVVGLNSSQEIWSTLIDAFAQESQERGFHLTHMLTTCKKGNNAIEVYVAKFKAICDDLAAIGKSVRDKEKAFWLLQGLGKGYEPFVMAMLKPPVPSCKELISLLQSLKVFFAVIEAVPEPYVA
ncbi:hypothetical protein EJ110_NYTH21915 [Nymphaea thermarum]|nr:hypothetical protein EJ110_NYTH21915 [Nymphaea thermarum]